MFYVDIHKTVRVLLTTVLFLVLFPEKPAADEFADRRAWAGLDLFPSFLAADDDIADKKGVDGMLHLLLVHVNRKDMVEEMINHLERIGQIRGIPIRVSDVGIDELDSPLDFPPAGIFLVERMGDRLEAVIRFGRAHQAIVFSPFAGDVERGVPSGLVISDRILPYINVKAMHLSGIRIKSFFLRIAEQYGG